MEEDAEQSLMFGNSEELEHPDSLLLRVSETTERTVTMETTERTGLLLWKQQYQVILLSAAEESVGG